jgi:aminoglycoside phosphotransferase (APT) family kinase protein
VGKMHADELDIDIALVARLLAGQFPRWAELPIEPVEPAGTDNAVFRLGTDMAVRLPRTRSAADTPAHEFHWLPRLAPLLPLSIPVPIALGAPAEGYPCQWSVCRWLEGETATLERIADPAQAAIDLAQFIAALQRIDPTDGPPPEGRGEPLATRDERTRESIASLAGEIDVDVVTAAWEAALHAPVWSDPPVWIHGDLDSRNVLVERGRLSAVLDFATMAVGDPACDVMVAWKMLPAETRHVFRTALSVDDATWARARGWVLSQALIALSYYTMQTNPVFVLECRRWMAEVLADRSPMSH